MGPFSFLTPKIALAGLLALGTGGAVVTTVVLTRPVSSPSSLATPTPPHATAPGVLHTLLGVTAAPTPTPVATPHVTLPAITSLPVATGRTGPPTITALTVSPDTWETWDASPDARCHTVNPVTPSSTTYAYLLATISAPYGVASVTGEYSFTGNSSAVFPLDLNYGSTTQWSTEIGGYIYTNYTGGSAIHGVETVTYTVHVTDKHGNVVTRTVTNNLHECEPQNPLKP